MVCGEDCTVYGLCRELCDVWYVKRIVHCMVCRKDCMIHGLWRGLHSVSSV